MESTQILAHINTEESVPYNWLVFQLQRRKVILGIGGWIVSAILGGIFFAFMAPIMIPHNYQSGLAAAIISTLLLGAVTFICLGSLWSMYVDIQRLRHASLHLIIITPDDFVKREGEKTIHVPLEYVKHVTARGQPPVDRSQAGARRDGQVGSVGENLSSLLVGRRAAGAERQGITQKRMRTPTSLAFIDSRTDDEVVVVTDDAFGDPFFIAAHLKQYVAAKIQNTVNTP